MVVKCGTRSKYSMGCRCVKCKTANRLYGRKRYLTDCETRLKSKKYYQANRKKIIARSMKYYIQNRKAVLERIKKSKQQVKDEKM